MSRLELSLEGGVGRAKKCGLWLRNILAQLEKGILKAVDYSQAIVSGFRRSSLAFSSFHVTFSHPVVFGWNHCPHHPFRQLFLNSMILSQMSLI